MRQSAMSEHPIVLLMAEGQFQSALDRICLEGEPDDAGWCDLAGICANRLGKTGQAEAFWLRAIELNPQACQPLLNLGALYAEQGRHDRAEQCFRRALAISPGSAAACANLALLFEKQARTEEARQFHCQAAHLDGESAEIRFNLANFLAGTGAEGDIEKAKSAFLETIRIMPTHFGAWVNLGNLLFETGYTSAAHTAYSAAVTYHPDRASAHVNLGNVLLHMGNLDSAQIHFTTALGIDPDFSEAHQGLASVYHRQGSLDRADYHRNRGFGGKPISFLPYRGGGEPVALLILASSREGNVPWRFLIDQQLFEATIVAVECFDRQRALPEHSLLFNAIGDADLCREGLEIACMLAGRSASPVINPPDAVLKTGRLDNAARLAQLPGVITPDIRMLSKAALLSETDMAFPLLLRSPGFHGGNYFVRVDDHDALRPTLNELPGDELLAMTYLDSRHEDGLFRKFRVMSIGGALYPVHMAVSSQWKVHYFSSDMAENASCRKEEEAFLSDFSACLGSAVVSALEAVGRSLGLDYCGMDFGIDRDGRLLLYEANATMSIVSPTSEKKWDYKRPAITNALMAAKRMFAERLGNVQNQLPRFQRKPGKCIS